METPNEPAPDIAGISDTISEDSLLSSIWFKPTATLRFILANCPNKYVTILLVLGGINRAADRAAQQNAGDHRSTISVLLLALVVGGLTGWITYYAYGWALSATGRWLGGRASADSFRTVLAWALVPTAVILALLLPQAVMFGDDLFKSTPLDTSVLAENLRRVFLLLEVVLSIWAVVIFLAGIRLVQGFSGGRALANMVLPGAILLGAIGLGVGVFKLL